MVSFFYVYPQNYQASEQKDRLRLPHSRREAPEKKVAFKPFRKIAANWGMMVFVAVWMFALGVWVGRGTIPVQFDMEKLHDELIELKGRFIQNQVEDIGWSADSNPVKMDFAYHEELKKNITDDSIEPTPPNEATQPFILNSPPGLQSVDSKIRVADAIENPEPRESFKTQPEPLVSLELNHPDAAVTIQVASFRDPKAADQSITELKEKGFAAYRSAGEIAGKGTWHRVRVGAFRSRNDANTVISKLKAHRLSPIIVNIP